MSGKNSEAHKLEFQFDFSCVSKKWQEEFLDSAEQATRAANTFQRPLRKQRADESEEAYSDYVQAFYDARDAAGSQLKLLSQTQSKLITQVLVFVPHEWLIPGAPEDLDWSNVASLDYVQMDHYDELLNLVQSGEARKQAKN